MNALCCCSQSRTGILAETHARRGDHFPDGDPPPKKKDIKHNQQTTAHIPTRLNLKNLQADRPKRLLL
jgi:hypothetical protein